MKMQRFSNIYFIKWNKIQKKYKTKYKTKTNKKETKYLTVARTTPLFLTFCLQIYFQ